MTFTVNDNEFSLPCEFGEITAFRASKSSSRDEIDPKYYSFGLMYEGYAYQVGAAECYAPDESDEDMSDNEVTYIRFSLSDMRNAVNDGEKLTFDYMGLGLDMTSADIKKKLGKPYNEKGNYIVFKKGSNDIMVNCNGGGNVQDIVIYTENARARIT